MSVDTIISAVSAGATLVAVYYARSTVLKASAAADQFDEAQATARTEHAEAIAEQRAAVAEDRAARAAEAAQRVRAFEADLAVRRITQLDQITALLLELVEVAREEAKYSPPSIDVGRGQLVTTSRIPALTARLQAAASALLVLGGVDIKAMLPSPSARNEAEARGVWFGALTLISQIEGMIETGEDRGKIEAARSADAGVTSGQATSGGR